MTIPKGKVWQTGSVPLYAVKLLANNGVEASMYEMLMSCPGLSNHTLPAQLIRCPQGDILLMPLLESLLGRGGAWNIDVFLDIFTQILQVCALQPRLTLAHSWAHRELSSCTSIASRIWYAGSYPHDMARETDGRRTSMRGTWSSAPRRTPLSSPRWCLRGSTSSTSSARCITHRGLANKAPLISQNPWCSARRVCAAWIPMPGICTAWETLLSISCT